MTTTTIGHARTYIASALALLVYTSDAFAKWPQAAPKVITLTDDRGGLSDLYDKRARAMARDGTRLRLAGFCASACTMYLWQRYDLQVCALPGSSLLFHKPAFMTGGKIEIGPEYVAKADALWVSEDMAELPANIARLLRGRYIPSASAGDSPWATVAIRALDVLPACE